MSRLGRRVEERLIVPRRHVVLARREPHRAGSDTSPQPKSPFRESVRAFSRYPAAIAIARRPPSGTVPRGMMASASCFAGSTSAVCAPAPLARRRARRPVARRAVPVHAASRDSRLPLGVDATFDGTGKTVLITGASSGIGLEAAKQMCAAGCHVLVAARSAEKARTASEEVAAHAGALGGSAEPVVVDLGRLAGVRAFAELPAGAAPRSTRWCATRAWPPTARATA